jgi:hypothetical protein
MPLMRQKIQRVNFDHQNARVTKQSSKKIYSDFGYYVNILSQPISTISKPLSLFILTINTFNVINVAGCNAQSVVKIAQPTRFNIKPLFKVFDEIIKFDCAKSPLLSSGRISDVRLPVSEFI